jgi:hypothetical protein
MPEDYNGYVISEQGGHKFVVTKPDDPDFATMIFHWPHDARAWIDMQPAAKIEKESKVPVPKHRQPEEEEDEPPKHHRSAKKHESDHR